MKRIILKAFDFVMRVMIVTGAFAIIGLLTHFIDGI